MTKKEGNAFKAISLVMILTLAGKLLGLFRDRLTAITFGNTLQNSAFIAASQIPRVFFDVVFASAIAASFIPVFSETMLHKGKREAMSFAGNFITVLGVISLILSVLGMIFTQPLVHFFVGGFDEQTIALCVQLTRIMVPTIAFSVLAFSFVGILQSLDEFNIPALISVVSNLIVIAYFFTFNGRFGIVGLAVAYLLGWLLQAVVQIPSLLKKGFFFHPSLRLRTEGMNKVWVMMLPVLISQWVQPINSTINTRFGSNLFGGTGVTAIGYSNNLYLIITGVFILSISNVIFPQLARLSASNDAAQFKETLSKTIRSSLFIVVPMMAGLMAMSRPIVNLIYGGGKFDAAAVDITSSSLRFISLGMVGFAVQTILSRAYFAKQNGRMPLIAGLVSIVVNLALSALLTGPLNVIGLALASAASATVNAVVLMIPLERQRSGFLSRAFIIDFLKMLLSAVVMGVLAYFLAGFLDAHLPSKLGQVITTAIPAALGVVVYFALTILLGVSDAKIAADYMKRIAYRIFKRGKTEF